MARPNSMQSAFAPAGGACVIRLRRSAPWVLLALGLAACAPALDWRDLPVQDLRTQFPCKPVAQSRKVKLAGAEVEMTLHACTAADLTWAVAHADVRDPALVGPALAELQKAAVRHFGTAPQAPAVAWAPRGATPQPLAQRLDLQGKVADGSVTREHMAVFVKGMVVYQATVLGAHATAEATEPFFTALVFAP